MFHNIKLRKLLHKLTILTSWNDREFRFQYFILYESNCFLISFQIAIPFSHNQRKFWLQRVKVHRIASAQETCQMLADANVSPVRWRQWWSNFQNFAQDERDGRENRETSCPHVSCVLHSTYPYLLDDFVFQ